VLRKLAELEKKIGYTFQSKDLLKQALTHRSAHVVNNERLEFLGDAALDFIIGSHLYTQFPEASEGQLTRLRSNLVNGEHLAGLAKNFELYDFIEVGLGEQKSGGARRVTILADALEALIAAIYFEAGIERVREIILLWFTADFSSVELDKIAQDPKTCLQEYCQSKKLPLPIYTIIQTEGLEHDMRFYVSCTVDGVEEEGRGDGRSRRRAEQEAAKTFLEKIGVFESNE